MKTSIYYKLVMAAACILLFSCDQNAQSSIIKKAKKKAYMLKHVLSLNGPIEFYAKVVDQFKQPVPNATVKCTSHFFCVLGKTPYFISGKAFEVKTDKNGLFEIKNMKGIDLAIASVEKDGYEYIMDPDNDTFDFENKSPTSHIADKNKPVLFKMRKRKHKPDFLLQPYILVVFKELSDVFYYDIVRDHTGKKKYWKGYHADIEISASFDKENNKYTCTLKALDPNAGIQELEKDLFSGPTTGYKKEVKIDLMHTQPRLNEVRKILYFKGNNKLFYSKLILAFRIYDFEGKKSKVKRIRIESTLDGSQTNPYGRPNFEYDGNSHISPEKRIKTREEVLKRLSRR